ncbi:hypothetical protein NL676_007439 [Syzygium grande]|nr:hypothetical protein NL676_007439 [Syzygium grande]
MGLNSNDPRSYGNRSQGHRGKGGGGASREDLGGVTEEGTGVPGKADHWSRKEEERGETGGHGCHARMGLSYCGLEGFCGRELQRE